MRNNYILGKNVTLIMIESKVNIEQSLLISDANKIPCTIYKEIMIITKAIYKEFGNYKI